MSTSGPKSDGIEELLAAARAALEALNETSGSSLAMATAVRAKPEDPAIPKILRSNFEASSEAALRLAAALKPFGAPNKASH